MFQDNILQLLKTADMEKTITQILKEEQTPQDTYFKDKEAREW